MNKEPKNVNKQTMQENRFDLRAQVSRHNSSLGCEAKFCIYGRIANYDQHKKCSCLDASISKADLCYGLRVLSSIALDNIEKLKS